MKAIHANLEFDEQDRCYLVFLVRKAHKGFCRRLQLALGILGDDETLTAQQVIALKLISGNKVKKRAKQELEVVEVVEKELIYLNRCSVLHKDD